MIIFKSKHKWLAIFTLFLMGLHSLNSVFLAVIISGIIDAATVGSMDIFVRNAVIGLIGFLIFTVIGLLMVKFRTDLIKRVNTSIKKVLIKDIVLFSENKEKHTNELSLMTNDLKQLETKGIEAELKMLQSIFTVIFAFIAAISFDLWITFVFFVGAFIPVVFSIKSQSKIAETSSKWTEANSLYTSRIKDFFNGIETVKTYQVEEKVINESSKEAERMENSLRKMNRTVETVDQIAYMTAMIFSVLMPFGVGVYRIIQFGVSIGSFMAIVQLSNSLTNPIMQIMQLYNGYGTVIGIKEKFFEALQRSNEELEVTYLKDKFKSIKIKNAQVKLGDTQIFDNLELDLKNGDKILVVGPSGEGKSTLLRVIQQSIPITEGVYKFNDKEVENSLMKMFSLIRQQPLMFNDSIKYNITLGEDYSDEEIMEVAQAAQIGELINQKGLDYEVGENGKNLSGGQKQRIEIARALIRKRPIILADEMTSALDEETSKLVREYITSSSETVIEVAHKVTDDERKLYDEIWDVTSFKGI